MSQRKILSIGSNIEPEVYIPRCQEALRQCFAGALISPVYETPPVGPAGDLPFWNFVALIDVDFSDEDLRSQLRQIEADLDRVRDPHNKYAPRTIDIDVLKEDDFQEFAFICIPLADLIPKEIDEHTGKTYNQLAERFTEERLTYKLIEI